MLKGARSLHWTASGIHYRAAYVLIPEDRVCLVFMIGTRENFYREAERRYRALKRRRDS